VFRHLGRRTIVGRKRSIAGVFAFALALAIAVSAYAFTASNTVPEHSAGAGSATVSGYVVSSPTNYTFSADGTKMTEVSFDLNKAASDVKVALTAAAPTQADWTDCGASETSPFAVTCKFPAPVPDENGLKLSVAAVSSGTVTIE
jgi:type 1 fimbria pilin